MYDIIARRRLSTVLRYIFDFLPKEETSIHLNTKKAVLSDRRNSDTEPYIMLNIFFVEDIFSPRWAEANKSRHCVLPGLRLPGFRQTSFPLPLFSRLSASAFLLHHRMRFKTLQYCPSSVAAADKSRRRTLSGFCLPGPRQTSFPLPLFSLTFRFPHLPRHRMRFKTLQCRHGSVTASDNQGALPCPVFVFPVSGT